jgi:hypothetical protein
MRRRITGVAVAILFVAGCDDDLPRFGTGHYCQRDDQCLEGLVCIARECAEPPAARGDPRPRADAGPDAGPGDAGPRDAGSMDAGALDAGSLDAGSPDAGAPDAGAADAGEPDAGEAADASGASGDAMP